MVWNYENRISRSVRRWMFTGLLSAIWQKFMSRYGKNWKVFKKLRNVSMKQNTWYIQRKRISPDTGAKTQEIFSAFFLYRRCDTYEPPCQKTDHLQCGSGNQYGCSLYHYASRRNCPGKKVYRLPQWKRPDVPILGRIRRFQREHGAAQTKSRWAYAKRLNIELGRKIAGAVTKYAKENHADIIIFEYLKTKGKISGRKKQRLHLWRKRDIQKRCEHQAHRNGMRISRICAWNTSRLAYDGTGTVAHDSRNHSLCVFQTGKRYNCDLSASYNIGARYFIRELLPPSVTERSLLEAKVPAVKRRTSCVYADLRKLRSEMNLRAA